MIINSRWPQFARFEDIERHIQLRPNIKCITTREYMLWLLDGVFMPRLPYPFACNWQSPFCTLVWSIDDRGYPQAREYQRQNYHNCKGRAFISLLFHVNHLKPILSRIIVDRSKPFAGKLQNVRERQAHGAHSISVIYSIDYFKYANACYIFISTSILREVKYKMFGTYFEAENKNVYMLTDKVCKYLYVFYVCILFEILWEIYRLFWRCNILYSSCVFFRFLRFT